MLEVVKTQNVDPFSLKKSTTLRQKYNGVGTLVWMSTTFPHTPQNQFLQFSRHQSRWVFVKEFDDFWFWGEWGSTTFRPSKSLVRKVVDVQTNLPRPLVDGFSACFRNCLSTTFKVVDRAFWSSTKDPNGIDQLTTSATNRHFFALRWSQLCLQPRAGGAWGNPRSLWPVFEEGG